MIAITAVAGLATVQDGGRRGHMHEGVPPGGPLVPELLARANAAAENEPTLAGIEVFGEMAVTASARAIVGHDDGTRTELREGESCRVASRPGRVRYLAIRGGFDVPVILGGRGTLLVACLGGYEGRALRRGDVLWAGDAPSVTYALPPPPQAGAILVQPGPDLDRFPREAFHTLLTTPFVVDARSDRTGIRLAGPSLPRVGSDAGVSAPMVRGAIQVPPSGLPVVLGPDHPTIGGYPVIATVVGASMGTIGALPIGASVTFEQSS